MFIETDEGQIINLDHVASVTRHKATRDEASRSHYYCTFLMSDGSQIIGHARTNEIDAVARGDNWDRVIPAAAGFFVLHYDYDECETVDREPVIAWRFTPGFECPYPVTVFGVSHGSRVDILHPDGRVVDPDMSSWPNYEMWLAEQRRSGLSKRTPWQEVYPAEADI